jgi:hypothetical protein
MQQVGHAMQVLRTKKRNARALGSRAQFPAHVEVCGQWSECSIECREIEFGIAGVIETPLDAHEEQSQRVVLVLVGVQNIRAVRSGQSMRRTAESFMFFSE